MTRYPSCGIEEIVARKPDIIIVSSMKRGGNFPRIRNKWMKWKNIPSVKNDQIYTIESNLIDHSSPRIVDGLEEAGRILKDTRDFVIRVMVCGAVHREFSLRDALRMSADEEVAQMPA